MLHRKIKSVGKRKLTQENYSGSPIGTSTPFTPYEGIHYDLYKVKQDNNPLFFTLLLSTILDNKVIPNKVKQENNPLFFTLLLPTILDSKVFFL